MVVSRFDIFRKGGKDLIKLSFSLRLNDVRDGNYFEKLIRDSVSLLIVINDRNDHGHRAPALALCALTLASLRFDKRNGSTC